MKMKSSLLAMSMLVGGALTSNAAIFLISNPADFATDTLYADSANVPMSSGLVTIGYFGSSIIDTDLNTTAKLVAQLGASAANFTVLSSAVPGAVMGTYSFGINGYADNSDVATSMGTITTGNALLGRTIYSIITSASSLGSATLTSGFAVVKIGTISDDVPAEASYTSNPAGLTPILGTTGTLTQDIGLSEGVPTTFNTLKMEIGRAHV